jgi:uncharacterized protein with FMN-binding domain
MARIAFLAAMMAVLAGCASNDALRSYYDSIEATDPDLVSFPDGRYRGEHALKPPMGVFVANNRVEVEVSIADHRYADIVILTKAVEGWSHLKSLRGLILERQTLQVDALTGATSLTGKAYVKAIENALADAERGMGK